MYEGIDKYKNSLFMYVKENDDDDDENDPLS